MKKLKLIALGAGILGLSAFGISYIGSSGVDAQQMMNCDWNGQNCKKPIDKTPCGCESPQIN